MTRHADIVCTKPNRDCPISDSIASLNEELVRLRSEARNDFLTGLFNKQHLLLSLENEMERTRRTSQPTTIMMVDADHFKKINDSYGHNAGDEVLKNLGKVIRSCTRKIDIPCRFGGEEFCIILPSTSIEVGLQVAERLRKEVEKSDTQIHSKETISLTISVGLSCYRYGSDYSESTFLEHCDKQLYRAKHEGRNRICIDDNERQTTTTVSAEEKFALFGKNKT